MKEGAEYKKKCCVDRNERKENWVKTVAITSTAILGEKGN